MYLCWKTRLPCFLEPNFLVIDFSVASPLPHVVEWTTVFRYLWPNYSSDCGCMWDWIGVSVKHLFVNMDTNWYSQSSFFASGWVWSEERLLHCRRRLGFGFRRTELGQYLNCDVVECRIRSLVLTSTLHSPFYAECLNQVVCIHFFLNVQRMKSVQVVSKHGCCLEFHIHHLFSIGTANTVHRCVGWMSLGWRENVSFQFQFRIPSTVIILKTSNTRP